MRKLIWLALLVTTTLANRELKRLKDEHWSKWLKAGVLGKSRDSDRNNAQECVGGSVTIAGEDFPCKEVNYKSFISLQEMEITDVPHMATGIKGTDIWGWRSKRNGMEVAIMCMDNGFSFVDVSNPVDPCVLALLPCKRKADSWGDVKVIGDVAYLVKDTRGGDSPDDLDIGGQVFDLTRLENMDCPAEPIVVEEDFLWDFHGSAHNIISDTENGFLYSCGGDVCSGGLMVIDVKKNKLEPEEIACIDGDGYTHDAQCIIYRGPDEKHFGKEICFAFNEEHLVIWDVVDKQNPIMLSKLGYPGQVYTHQGWLNDDMTLILMNDELNEQCNGDDPFSDCLDLALGGLDGSTKTSTYFVDVTVLEEPILTGTYRHNYSVIDHNLYFWGPIHRYGWGGNERLTSIPDPDLVYLHHYDNGLRIFNASTKSVEGFDEIGYFDVAPERAGLNFLGSWSGYMFPSGTYVVSSIDRGLFVLEPTMPFVTVKQESSDGEETVDTVLRSFIAVFMTALVVYVIYKSKHAYDEYRTSHQNLSQRSAKVPASGVTNSQVNPMYATEVK